MIELTRLDNTIFILNCELIESIEEKPDTIVSTISGRKYIVKESIEELIEKVVEYKSRILRA